MCQNGIFFERADENALFTLSLVSRLSSLSSQLSALFSSEFWLAQNFHGWTSMFMAEAHMTTRKANLHGWTSDLYFLHLLLPLLLLLLLLPLLILLLLLSLLLLFFFFFFPATAIAAASSSSSLMIHIDLYMGLMIWFCKWVWGVWDLDFQKIHIDFVYGFDDMVFVNGFEEFEI